MNRVDKMRQKQAEKHGSPPPKVSAASEFNGLFQDKEPKKEKTPQPQKSVVTFSCGHEKPVNAFKCAPCADCRSKAQKEKKQHRQETGKLPGGRNPIEREQRLPDRAAFYVSYDALKKEWKGTLSVPDAGGFKVFQGSAGGLERLERDLARQCWEWMETANLQG